jgi:hypothetical protein
MIHWAHILREMLVCEPGKSFIVWLTKSQGAAERIPRKNVLSKYKSDPRAKEIGQGAPAQIIAYLSPVLLRQSHNFAEDFRRYLGEIEIEVPMDWDKAILAPETVKPTADIAFSIPEKYLHHYIHHFPKELKIDQFHEFNGAKSWQSRIIGVTKLKDLLRVAALLRCVFEFGEEYKGPDTGWGHFGHAVEKIETPVKIAEFASEQAKLLIEAGFGAKDLEKVAELIAAQGTKGIYMEPYASKLFKATNALKAMKVLHVAERLLSGPVGFMMGGFELMLQEHESLEAMESGDTNAAMAHQIKAIAGGLVAVVGVAETLSLFGVVGELAWVGPVGWIAAGLMLLGEIFLAYGKQTDFELYAAHCFLGRKAGKDGDEPTNLPWMGDISWKQLAEPRYGRLALLGLLSGFSVWIGWYPLQDEGPWWQIKAHYIPDGSYFEVEVDFWNLPLTPSKVTQTAVIFPDGKLVMDDSTGCAVKVYHYDESTVFAVKITPRSKYRSDQNWDNIRFEWGVRVRMVFDGVHKLPAKGWVKNQHGTISSETSTSGE